MLKNNNKICSIRKEADKVSSHKLWSTAWSLQTTSHADDLTKIRGQHEVFLRGLFRLPAMAAGRILVEKKCTTLISVSTGMQVGG